MSQELLKKAHRAVSGAEKRGAQGVRATMSRSRDSEVEWLDGRLDRIRESTTMGLSLTLFVDGRFSTHSTSDLRSEALDGFLDEAVAMTRLLAEDPHRKLPDPERYANRFGGDLGQYDPQGAAAVTGISRRRMAQAIEDAARSAPGADRIISVKGSASDTSYETAMVTSNGMEGISLATSFVAFAQITVRDDDDRRPMGWWYAVSLQRDKLDSVEDVGRKALGRALEGLGEKPEKSGLYPCVVENSVVRRVLRGLGAPLGGRAIQQQRSFLADKIGVEIASPVLTITDDPHVYGGLGSATFDDEGMSTRKIPIIERGVLRNFYLDTYYASKLGMEATTGSRTNQVFEGGDKDLDGLLKAMGTGILITGFSGGNSNSATGDFSIGIRGHWIEGGKRVRPIAEMNLAGNHLTFWKRLAEVGNDPYTYSSTRVPSLRFDEVQFSGV
jgi:PmbA protein